MRSLVPVANAIWPGCRADIGMASSIVCIQGDVRDFDTLRAAARDADVIYHYKLVTASTQDTKGRLAKRSVGVAKRQNPLHLPVAFVTGGAMGALPPQHPKAQHPFGSVVGCFDPMLDKEHPKRHHLALQASG